MQYKDESYPEELHFDPKLFINTQTAHYVEFNYDFQVRQHGDFAGASNSVSDLQWTMNQEHTGNKNRVRSEIQQRKTEQVKRIEDMRDRMKTLMRDHRLAHRVALREIPRAKEAFKELGEKVREAGSLDMLDSEDLLNWVEEYPSFVTGSIRDEFESRDDIYRCSCCEEHQYEPNHGCNTTAGRDGPVCDHCRDNYYNYSECQDAYIHQDNAHRVAYSYSSYEDDEPDDWCTHTYGNNNYYEEAGWYFVSEEDRDEACDQRYDRDRENYIRNSPGTLSGYHDTPRRWVETNSTPTVPSLGVELEVYAQGSRNNIVAALRSEYGTALMLERDGSLDGDKGFEIITHPMGRTEWATFGPKLLTTLRKASVVGFDTPDSNSYGIHVNVHRNHLSPLAEARIMMFLCANENADFVTAIAQRRSIYAASMEIGQLVKRTQTIRHIGGVQFHNWNNKATKKIQGVGKYAPVCWKDDVAEFRLFNSTLNETSFMKDLEFVWALVAWTHEATGSSWLHQDFLSWLSHPACRTTYPALVKYLSRSMFRIKNEDDVESTWQRQMFRPVDGFADYTETYVAPAAQLVA